jgi:hypothetical protein
MQKYKYITLLFVVLFLVGCAKDDFITIGDSRGEKAVYGFGVGGGTTRTFINDDGVTISWDKDDKVVLWAKAKGSDSYTLSNKTFDTWFVSADNSQAYFTAKLDSQMPDSGDENKNDDYTYYVCYPLPQSVSGTTATFNLPSTQDGKMGGGADIMVAQGTGPALAKLYTPANPNDSNVVPDYVIKEGVKLQMKHLIHALRFYVPQGKWGFPQGETVERIVFTMPANVAGTVTADVAAESPALSSPTNATNTISLNLKEPIGPSAADGNGIVNYDYACASIIPNTYSGDMTVKVYSQTKASQVTIPIDNRKMAAGHITPVGLNSSKTVNQYVLRIKWGGNNLGENVNKITFHNENGNEVSALTITDITNKFKKVGDYYDIDLSFGNQSDIDAVKALAGKNITVKYDSDHAIVSTNFIFPSGIENGFFHEETLTVPYLFFEDFSTVSSISSNDEYESGFNSGSKSAVSFLSGWTGARIGAQAGTSIRIASRRETSADYPARVDSAPLSGIKDGKTVNIKVTYDYGVNYEGTHTGGQTILQGYVISNEAYSSGESIYSIRNGQQFSKISGTFAEGDRFVIDGTDGSYTNIPETGSFTLYGRNNATRLTWAAVTKHKVGANNTTSWFYLDNIKVQIVK